MFRKKNLAVVPKNEFEAPTTTDAAWFERLLDHGWDHDDKQLVTWLFERAWLGEEPPEDPLYFVPLFTELKPRVEHALQNVENPSEQCYAPAILKLLAQNREYAAEPFPKSRFYQLLPLQRAISVASVFGVRPGVREVLLDAMREPHVFPTFGFRAVLALAKLRSKNPLLTREELVWWKTRLLSVKEGETPKVLIEVLELLECALGHD